MLRTVASIISVPAIGVGYILLSDLYAACAHVFAVLAHVLAP